ncbi:uncharacterized protein CXQ87_004962 [Candidozyma duobushaemuli]|uniref:DNA polymerase delta subunit 3 n=1 Tax=Candidozyma duobushaemuli TaxID=1231522 RepID=A0A2V1AGH4_9ASCO|nr:uncharacterized protein CXQ87_004962 [[Candida] duobushaemulonis]PVH16666.1 hypothetical protein CXQ87_004962 [[Candida] duobushaemulonis]
MDITPDQVRYIADKLDSHTVTFSSVSRDLNVHNSQAKRILYAYYSSNKEKLNALYVASGTQGTKTVVKIVENPDENYLSDSFDQVGSIHIYSISQNKFSFSTSDIALEQLRRPVDFDKVESYYELGMIRGRPLKTVSAQAAPRSKVESKPKLQYQSRKEKPQASLLSNYVSRKEEKKQKEDDSKKRKPEQSSGYQYKSRKMESKQPKERVIVSNETEEPEEEEPQKKAAPAKTTDLNSLFLDDLSDFSDNDDTKEAQEKEEPIMVEPEAQSKPQEDEQQPKATIAPSLPQGSSLRSLTSKSPTPQAGENAGTAEDAQEPEPVTTIDDEGYIVTKKAEPKKNEAPKPARRAAPAPKKATPSNKKSDGTKKQASLMSFFDRR